jgi:hypothetical protein
MPTNTSISTLYTHTNTPIHFRKLDNRVEQVRLYGAKDAKKMTLNEVISNERILKRLAVIQKRRNEEEVVKKEGKTKKPKSAEEPMEATDKDIYGNLETTIDGQKIDDPDLFDFSADDKYPEVPTRLIVGFDTEYVAPEPIKYYKDSPKPDLQNEPPEKNKALSYQYCAILATPRGDFIKKWTGILYVDHSKEERVSRSDLMTAVYSKAFEDKDILQLPLSVILVGHYTKADLPMFSDFKEFRNCIDAVRRSFITVVHDRNFAEVPLLDKQGDIYKTSDPKTALATPMKVYVLLRDTYLLCPTLKRSLKAIGNLIGKKKIEIPKESIRRMDIFLKEDPVGFERYAIRDAEIAAKYAYRVYRMQTQLGLRKDVPPTLSSIGVALLYQYWMYKHGRDLKTLKKGVLQDRNVEVPLDMLGQRFIRDSKYVKSTAKRKAHMQKVKKVIERDLRAWFTSFTTDCYHGGRNEQYQFGAGKVSHWFDYDLRSAYPTAMAVIGKPDWEKIYQVLDEDFYKKVKADDLAFFQVDFEFPEDTRYPTLPVRTPHGLIFPLKGISCCAAPEIVVARSLGVKIRTIFAINVEVDKTVKPFEGFVLDCIKRRGASEKNSLEEHIWKEITNGTYGKTAQGLKEKRAFNVRSEDSKPINPSKITNSFYAAYTTSFVRAVLGEIINQLPVKTELSNVTTDGFLCDASREEVLDCLKGDLGRLYHENAETLHGKTKLRQLDFLSRKAEIKQPLGWKTRGQATLQRWPHPDKGEEIVLAKAGIRTEEWAQNSDWDQNEEIVKKFLERHPLSTFKVEYDVGNRFLYGWNLDNILMESERTLNMEYDWKREPINPTYRKIRGQTHLFFDTKPWENVESFLLCRDAWDDYLTDGKKILKTPDDLTLFLAHKERYKDKQERKEKTKSKRSKYLSKDNPDIDSLRTELCRAFAHGVMGFPKIESRRPNKWFTKILYDAGLLDKKTPYEEQVYHAENGVKKAFRFNSVTSTPDLLIAFEKVKKATGFNLDGTLLWS